MWQFTQAQKARGKPDLKIKSRTSDFVFPVLPHVYVHTATELQPSWGNQRGYRASPCSGAGSMHLCHKPCSSNLFFKTSHNRDATTSQQAPSTIAMRYSHSKNKQTRQPPQSWTVLLEMNPAPRNTESNWPRMFLMLILNILKEYQHRSPLFDAFSCPKETPVASRLPYGSCLWTSSLFLSLSLSWRSELDVMLCKEHTPPPVSRVPVTVSKKACRSIPLQTGSWLKEW